MKKKSAASAPALDPKVRDLHQLAALLGVQTEYNSAFGTVEQASTEGILYVLKPLGVNVREDLSDVSQVLERETLARWTEVIQPVAVLWDNKKAELTLRVDEALRKQKAELKLQYENGEVLRESYALSRLPAKKPILVGGRKFFELRLPIKERPPLGYHRATLRLGGKKYEIFIIAAPFKAYKPSADEAPAYSCGIFAPLYAIRSKDSWGIGDFGDLNKFVCWSYGLGTDFIGTLPMLATFTDKPMVEPSPYSPVSRIFWNEIFVDPRLSDEWPDCAPAREMTETPEFLRAVEAQQALREVDYLAVARLKRQVLHVLADFFFEQKRDAGEEFKAFLKVQPLAADYAEFRATCDRTGTQWQEWPERQRSGKLEPGDYDDRDRRYYLYCQYLAHQQLSELSRTSGQPGKRGIYLDFPLSAHAGGYDVWRERESFAHVCTAGCPPDPAHSHGQNWGILPLNPKTIRDTGYRYFRACLENHMRYAGFLRLDHVMCFFRLFWVPQGKTAKEGVYIRYALDEFFALLSLESQRNRCELIGEDLGTVPPEIREAMNEHGILRMYCQQRRLAPNEKEPFAEVPPNCICSLNTHDMPPFAAFCQGLEIEDKMQLGYYGQDMMEKKKAERLKNVEILMKHLKRQGLLNKPTVEEALRGMLLLTAKGPAAVMQVNVEDLWLETLSQNVPGTWKERPNWKRKLKYSLEEMRRLKKLPDLFKEIISLRRSKTSQGRK